MMHAADAPYPFVFFVLHPFLFPLFVLQLNKFEMKSRLSRFIAEDPLDLLLPREEAIRLSTEAFRLWAVAAGYGQACDLYRYSSRLEKRGWRAQQRQWTSCSKGANRGISRLSLYSLQGVLLHLLLPPAVKLSF